jgi:hypothetical protein
MQFVLFCGWVVQEHPWSIGQQDQECSGRSEQQKVMISDLAIIQWHSELAGGR